MRFPTGPAAWLAAWLAGTALAGCLVWFGAGLVLRNAVASSGVPVVTVAPSSPSGSLASPVPSRTPVTASSSVASPVASPAVSSAVSAGSPAAGTVRTYSLSGGHVTLLLTATSARLVTAVPDDGYSVQNWSGAGWLRVDFSSGTNVSSLIAAWNGHPPSVTVTN